MLELGEFRMEAVLFALNGVLVDSASAVERDWLRWAVEKGLDPARVVAAARGRNAAEVMAEFLPDRPAGVDRLEALRMGREQAARVHFLRASPGAADALVELGPRWGVVTSSSREVAEARLAAAGLPVPPVLVTSDDVAAGKPDPAGYLRAADQLGVPSWCCLAVEASVAGVAACRAAGVPVFGLGLPGGPAAEGAIGRLESLRQLSAVTADEGVCGVLRDPVPA